ncbi:MAG: hypothetical protein Q4P72_06900 [Eubacteriales bacterium]|nr:hypothetical protein [Eubacteriales bacterium]
MNRNARSRSQQTDPIDLQTVTLNFVRVALLLALFNIMAAGLALYFQLSPFIQPGGFSLFWGKLFSRSPVLPGRAGLRNSLFIDALDPEFLILTFLVFVLMNLILFGFLACLRDGRYRSRLFWTILAALVVQICLIIYSDSVSLFDLKVWTNCISCFVMLAACALLKSDCRLHGPAGSVPESAEALSYLNRPESKAETVSEWSLNSELQDDESFDLRDEFEEPDWDEK